MLLLGNEKMIVKDTILISLWDPSICSALDYDDYMYFIFAGTLVHRSHCSVKGEANRINKG